MSDKNNVASGIRAIAYILFICAIILCIVTIIASTWLYILIAVGVALSGLMLLGLSEIIFLLHESRKIQDQMLYEFKNAPTQTTPTKESTPPTQKKSVVEDIEDELPDI